MMVRKVLRTATLFASLIALCCCARKKTANNLPIKQYDLHGRIVSLDPQTHSAVIQGKEIPGWMSAMTMEYPVKVETEYQNLRPGEQIRATVFVQGLDYWIAGIRREALADHAPEVPAVK